MKTIFIGGSRHISRLPAQVMDRLNNVVSSGHRVIAGDANGADKAVQKHLLEAGYDNVTIFCSGDRCRNNLGQWQTRHVLPPKGAKGFQFFAAKDREMAREADFGLMIWDGKSPGTALNVLRLVQSGKIAVLINTPDQTVRNFKSDQDWDEFLSQCSPDLRADLRDRATAEEWEPGKHSSRDASPARSEDELAAAINAALGSGDPALVVDALGTIARARGMTQVAKASGLARESLYRSLGNGGNPEFATILKVMASLGLRLEVSRVRAGESSHD